MLPTKEGGTLIQRRRIVPFGQRRMFVSNSYPVSQRHEAVESLAQGARVRARIPQCGQLMDLRAIGGRGAKRLHNQVRRGRSWFGPGAQGVIVRPGGASPPDGGEAGAANQSDLGTTTGCDGCHLKCGDMICTPYSLKTS